MSHQPPVNEQLIARLRATDRAIILGLARRLKQWQEPTKLPVQTLVFAAVALCHGLANVALCFLTEQPEWLWAVAFAATGAVAFYVLDDEPLEPAEEGIFYTQFGCEDRWMMWRLAYLLIATVGTLGLLFEPTMSQATLLVFLVEILALAVMEYLLCFRLVDAATEESLKALLKAIKDVFSGVATADEPDETPSTKDGSDDS